MPSSVANVFPPTPSSRTSFPTGFFKSSTFFAYACKREKTALRSPRFLVLTGTPTVDLSLISTRTSFFFSPLSFAPAFLWNAAGSNTAPPGRRQTSYAQGSAFFKDLELRTFFPPPPRPAERRKRSQFCSSKYSRFPASPNRSLASTEWVLNLSTPPFSSFQQAFTRAPPCSSASMCARTPPKILPSRLAAYTRSRHLSAAA